MAGMLGSIRGRRAWLRFRECVGYSEDVEQNGLQVAARSTAQCLQVRKILRAANLARAKRAPPEMLQSADRQGQFRAYC